MRITPRLLLAPLACLAALFGLAGVSGAQDGPAIEIDPTSIPEAGTTDVTISGSGFTIDVFVLQCPGAGGSIDALAEGDATTLCDIGNLLTGSPDGDGSWEVTFTGVEVTDCGLVFVAGDLEQTEVGGPVLLSVENPAEGVECDVVEDAGYDLSAAGGGSELTEAASAGDTSIEVADEAAFSEGVEITICPGCDNEESNTVSSFGSLVLASPLASDHEAGEPVVVAGAEVSAADDALAATGSNTATIVLIATAVVIFGALLAVEARRLIRVGSR